MRVIKFVLSQTDDVAFSAWAGIYALGVGFCGLSHYPLLRYYALWGGIRLDWFYGALVVGGLLALVLGDRPLSGRPGARLGLVQGCLIVSLGLLLGWFVVAARYGWGP